MKIKIGGMVAEMSGALGNVVASKNRYGAYLRSRVVPTKVVTDATNDVRGRLSSLSQAYAALTDAQQESWKTWAAVNPITDRLGDKRVLQPSAAFIQLNARILQAGGTQIDVPPVAAAPAAIVGLGVAAAAGAGTVAISWTSGALGANECLAVWIALVDSAGRSYYRNLLKLVKVTAAAATTPQAVGADVLLRFGTMVAGQVIHVEAEVWSDVTGLVSGRVYKKATVGA